MTTRAGSLGEDWFCNGRPARSPTPEGVASKHHGLGTGFDVPAPSEDAPEKSFGSLVQEANALREAGRWKDAARCYDAVLARTNQDQARGQEGVLNALFLKIFCLHEEGDARQALAACDTWLTRFADSDSPKAVEVASTILWIKSRALSRSGQTEHERKILRQMIDRYADERRPFVADAMYNEGIHLRDEGREDEAIRLWDELFARFAPDPPKSDPFLPIRGQLAKSHVLAGTGRLDGALVTCERMLQEGARLQLPDARLAEIRRAAATCLTLARKSCGMRGRLRTLVKRS